MLARIISVLFISTLLFSSCKSKKAVTTRSPETTKKLVKPSEPLAVEEPKKTTSTPATTEKPKPAGTYANRVSNYIDSYSAIAKEEMLQYGIPASITLAQGILESGAGNGSLTKRANNHFGIKCHRGWEGEKVYHDDDEAQECFRKYKDAKYSFRDHSLFLSERTRYRGLFKLRKSDYKGWARGLKKAGYATDPKYPEKLISIIERYNLTQYDVEVLSQDTNTASAAVINTYEVRKGDTLYSIARRFNITVDTIKRYNGLTSNDISIGQELYLHAVKN